MDDPPVARFEIQVDEGPPRGDLYEFVQTTTYRVVDTHSGEVVLRVEGTLEARLSPDTGLWDDFQVSGARGVRLSDDGYSALVDWGESKEVVPLL